MFASRALGFDLSLAPGLSVKNAFLYLIFLVLAIQTVITRQRKLEILSVIVPFGLYVVYAIFTWVVIVLVINYPGYSIRTTLISLKSGPVEHLLVLLVYFYGISDSKRALWVLRGIVWLVIIGNVLTVVDALNIPDLGLIDERWDGRVGGPIGNSNEYGAFLALFLPAIFTLYLTSKGSKKLLAGLGVALSGLAFVMALSRGAIVGLAVGGVLGAYLLRPYVPSKTIIRTGLSAVSLCVVVVVGGFAAGYGDLVLERFGELGESSTVASSGRTAIWGKALGSILDHPITLVTGFGWNAYESSRYFNYATHNFYLNTLYNLGMIGVSLFLLVVVNVLRVVRAALGRAAPEAKPWLIAFVIGFLALLVSIFFGELYVSWLYVWAFVGIVLRIAVLEMDPMSTTGRHKMGGVTGTDNDNPGQRADVIRPRTRPG